jgi:ribonuclease HI
VGLPDTPSHVDNPSRPVRPAASLLTVYADGLCEPTNPGGYACWAWVALQDGQEIATAHGCLGDGQGMTNNLAEYHAVLQALRWLQAQCMRQATLHTDSLLVVKQATGQWRVKSAHLYPLATQAMALLSETETTLRWVPREANERADELTRVAYARTRGGQR